MKNHILHRSSSFSSYSSWQISFAGWNFVKMHLVSFCHKCWNPDCLNATELTHLCHASICASISNCHLSDMWTFLSSIIMSICCFLSHFLPHMLHQIRAKCRKWLFYHKKKYFYPVIHSPSWLPFLTVCAYKSQFPCLTLQTTSHFYLFVCKLLFFSYFFPNKYYFEIHILSDISILSSWFPVTQVYATP